MINKLYSSISFRSNDLFKGIPALNPDYTTEESKAKTVTVLGSSKSSDAILNAMDLCSKTSKVLVNKGYNILTGCGTKGIMGSAHFAASESSAIDISTGKPKQNLAIVVEPAWGDEDLEHCTPIGKATSEADRIEKFGKTSNTFLIFPGSATTIQEAVSLIQQNEYSKDQPLKKILLVGKKYFEGLKIQYDKLAESKLLKHKPDELFKVVDSEDEILKEIK